MNLSSGYPLWLIRQGIPYDYPKLLKNIRADIVILGGGITGALVAFHLQRAGIDAILVDGRTLGLGSTCASTSLLQYEIDTPLSQLKNMVGEKEAVRAYEISARSIIGLAEIAKAVQFPDFQYKKSIYYATYQKHVAQLEQELAARQQMGLEVSWLNADALENQYGILAPGAILSATAAQTNAYGLMHALHQYNIRSGMRVYDRTCITVIEQKKRSVSLTTSEGYKIRCRKLVHATGYETAEIIGRKIFSLSSTYAVASEQTDKPGSLATNDIILWGTARPYLYARATIDNRVIAGGRDENFFSAPKRDALIDIKSKQLVTDFRKLVPGNPFRKEFSWAGSFASTKDGLPLIGRHPSFPNSLFALGFGGNGITFGLIAAEMVTDIISGRTNKDISLFAFDRL
jgi:glycine/D-amino acid oxidase-like deaminating enzyme